MIISMRIIQFLATERTIVEDAYPGDIIGVFDNGTMGVGDTLFSGKKKVTFKDFPTFPPELFARIRAKDSMKRKQFLKGMTQLELARQLGVAFGDAAKWGIPLLFDGVHFSPEGHQHFAAHLAALLAELFPGDF